MKSVALKSIGTITGAHGLRGEVNLRPWDADAAWVGHVRSVFVFRPRGPVEMQIVSARRQGPVVIVQFREVTDRTEAENLKGAEVKAAESGLPPPGEDEYYVDDLIGMKVHSAADNRLLGEVRDVLSSAAGDFLEVDAPGLSEPVLVPFQGAFVDVVDPEARIVQLQGLDDLFEASPGA